MPLQDGGLHKNDFALEGLKNTSTFRRVNDRENTNGEDANSRLSCLREKSYSVTPKLKSHGSAGLHSDKCQIISERGQMVTTASHEGGNWSTAGDANSYIAPSHEDDFAIAACSYDSEEGGTRYKAMPNFQYCTSRLRVDQAFLVQRLIDGKFFRKKRRVQVEHDPMRSWHGEDDVLRDSRFLHGFGKDISHKEGVKPIQDILLRDDTGNRSWIQRCTSVLVQSSFCKENRGGNMMPKREKFPCFVPTIDTRGNLGKVASYLSEHKEDIGFSIFLGKRRGNGLETEKIFTWPMDNGSISTLLYQGKLIFKNYNGYSLKSPFSLNGGVCRFLLVLKRLYMNDVQVKLMVGVFKLQGMGSNRNFLLLVAMKYQRMLRMMMQIWCVTPMDALRSYEAMLLFANDGDFAFFKAEKRCAKLSESIWNWDVAQTIFLEITFGLTVSALFSFIRHQAMLMEGRLHLIWHLRPKDVFAFFEVVLASRRVEICRACQFIEEHKVMLNGTFVEQDLGLRDFANSCATTLLRSICGIENAFLDAGSVKRSLEERQQNPISEQGDHNKKLEKVCGNEPRGRTLDENCKAMIDDDDSEFKKCEEGNTLDKSSFNSIFGDMRDDECGTVGVARMQISEESIPLKNMQPPGISSTGIMRDYLVRRHTYASITPWSGRFSADSFADAGFYVAFDDIITCFSCQAQHNVRDIVGCTPENAQWHNSGCEMLTRCRPGTSSSRLPGLQRLPSSTHRPSSSAATQAQHRPLIPWRMANVLSDDHRRMLANLFLNRELDRLASFSRCPIERLPIFFAELAKHGFFYLGDGDRTQCFSCGGVLTSWGPSDRSVAKHREHFPNCKFVLGEETPNVPIPQPSESSEEREQNFPCRFPSNPHMRSEATRQETFHHPRWPLGRTAATPVEFAQAGFFFLGDSIKCWYCNGKMNLLVYEHVPWTEHAKWFPSCQFLLHAKGQRYVYRELFRNSRLARQIIPRQEGATIDSDIPDAVNVRQPSPLPIIIDPQEEIRMKKERIENAIKSSEVVKNILQMGFPEEIVRMVLEEKVDSDSEAEENPVDIYGTVTGLFDDVRKKEKEQEQEESSTSSTECNSSGLVPRGSGKYNVSYYYGPDEPDEVVEMDMYSCEPTIDRRLDRVTSSNRVEKVEETESCQEKLDRI